MKRNIAVALIIALVIAGLFAAMRKNAPRTPPPTTAELWEQNGIPVKTTAVTMGDMEQTVEVTGDIQALDKATLSAKISGRVAQVNVREGDRVSKGQTIIVLDQQDLQSNLVAARGGLEAAVARLSQAKTSLKVTKIQTDAAITQAKAQLDAANARLAVAKNPARSQERMMAENTVAEAKANLDRVTSDYKRNQNLLNQGAISQSTFEMAETQYKIAQTQHKSAVERLSLITEGGRTEDVQQAEAQVAVAKEALRTAEASAAQNLLRKEDVKQAEAGLSQARASVAIAEQQLSYSYVKSPVPGVVSARLTEPGQVINPGQGLAEVVNLGSLYLKGNVSEKIFAQLNIGQAVRINIDAIPGSTFMGSLAEIYPSGSTSSRNFPVRIALSEGSSKIRPGMFARGAIVTETKKDILLVPKDAIDHRKGTESVFSVGDDNTVTRHIVSVIQENRKYVQIQMPTTLKTGDIVVTEGRQNLQQGSKVALEK
ncbi:MAG: efflux RND transporter periplasmic adaptor subunit [Armatimonadetes bacterium]|nr:efflux RND transporter periplasmic adaptor subunit [Armatimonadota bacterium]